MTLSYFLDEALFGSFVKLVASVYIKLSTLYAFCSFFRSPHVICLSKRAKYWSKCVRSVISIINEHLKYTISQLP